MILLDEKKGSAKAKPVNELIEKLTTINWYSNVGQKNENIEQALISLLNVLEVDQFKLEWTNKNDLDNILNEVKLSGSTVWEKLEGVPDQLKKAIEQQGELELLEPVIDLVPEVIYHKIFENAYNTFKEERLVKFFVGQALYFSVLICAAEIAGETKLAEQFLNVIETGNIPVGPKGDIIYIV